MVLYGKLIVLSLSHTVSVSVYHMSRLDRGLIVERLYMPIW
jgi:hypothetical protein